MTEPLKGLVVGVANDKSIAWACARAIADTGAALAVTYEHERAAVLVRPLATKLGADIIMPLDVTDEAQMTEVFAAIQQRWGRLDFILHSIAVASGQDLMGRIIDSSAGGFNKAMDISCHSLVRLAKHAEPLMCNGGSILTMSYYGAEKVMPHFNLMGPVKAALEASVRYLAWELGLANIRVNALSPGPVRTGSVMSLRFDELMSEAMEKTPLHRPVTLEQIGAVAAFMVSDKASGISGQVIHVDNGYHSVG